MHSSLSGAMCHGQGQVPTVQSNSMPVPENITNLAFLLMKYEHKESL